MLPFKIHSFALEKPTSLGRKKLAAPSKTIPLLANGKANFDFFEAILISIAKVIVAPIPTAAPLIAAIMGVSQSNIAKFKMPPASRFIPFIASAPIPLSRLAPPNPLLISAPAQKALPAPVTTIDLTEESSSAETIAFKSAVWSSML